MVRVHSQANIQRDLVQLWLVFAWSIGRGFGVCVVVPLLVWLPVVVLWGEKAIDVWVFGKRGIKACAVCAGLFQLGLCFDLILSPGSAGAAAGTQ
eukprot:10078988-Ditylum_brightwellii.AAC.1